MYIIYNIYIVIECNCRLCCLYCFWQIWGWTASLVDGNWQSKQDLHWHRCSWNRWVTRWPIWSNYSDLTRPHPKWWFSKGNPLISGKPRLVKYYNLARPIRAKTQFCSTSSSHHLLCILPLKLLSYPHFFGAKVRLSSKWGEMGAP